MNIATAANKTCYHCGLDVPQHCDFSLVIKGIRHAMCCPGCAAVAATIFENGLQSFYAFRSAPSVQVVENSPSDTEENPFADWDLGAIQHDYISQTDQGLLRIRLYIGNITCAACTWLIEQHLGKLPGVDRIRINGTTRRGEIIWTPEILSLSDILLAIKQIGYDASPITCDSSLSPSAKESRNLLLRLGVAGLAMMQTGMVSIALYAGSFQGMESEWQNVLRLISVLFVTPVVFYSAQPFFISAWRNLKMRHLVMDLPVAIALALAYSASLWATFRGVGEVYFDSITMFSFFLLLGRFAEQRIRDKNLLLLNRGTLLPPVATQVFPQGDCSDGYYSEAKEDRKVPIKTLSAGDFIRVNAGQIIPCDGLIEEGSSQVSEALLTGESQPLSKQAGQFVYGGTVNGANPLLIKVSATGEATCLSSIVALAERAALDKPQWAMLADRLAGYFIGALLFIAAAVATYWWFYEPQRALWITLSVLVVTCPCALSLATPTALTVTSNVLRARGFLINRIHVLETLAAIDQVVFDKTGTLTEGDLKLVAVDTADRGGEVSEPQIIAWAASLERGSQHPVAIALNKSAPPEIGMAAAVTEQSFVTGCGVTGKIDAETFYLGSPTWVCQMAGLEECSIDDSIDRPDKQPSQCIEVGFARPGEWLATFSFADQLRPTAVAAVNQLRERGLKVSLLSGDPSPGAAQIIEPLGLRDCQLSLQPEQKLIVVRDLQQRGKRVLMVGDGINDVPVLQAADVSVALGQASDLSQIHADVTLLSGDLRALPEAIATATQTRRIIKQNTLWAIGYNLVALPLAAAGYVPPWAAAIGMSGSSLLVMLNALRLAKGVKF